MLPKTPEAFAVFVHGTQRYGGDRPYRVHLEAVAKVVRDFAGLFSPDESRDLEAAAWLHDTLEDTMTTPEQLEAAFGPAVTALVKAVTNDPWLRGDALHAKMYGQIRAAGRLAVALKLADRIANGAESRKPGQEAFLTRYRKGFEMFRGTAYCAGELDPMWDRLRDTVFSA